MTRIVAFLDAAGEAITACYRVNEDGKAVACDPPAASVKPRPQVIAVVPGAEVLTRRVSLPQGAAAKRLAALPYVLEDDLSASPETLHFAMAQDRGPGDTLVAATSFAAMDRWTETLRAAGIVPDAVVPDYLCLPWDKDAAVADVTSDGGRVRLPDGTGFSAERDLLAVVLGPLLSERQVSRAVCHGAAISTPIQTAPRPALSETDRAQAAARLIRDATVPNLLQGRYAARTAWFTQAIPWKRMAALAAALMLLAAGQLWWSTLILGRDAAQAYARADAAAAAALPTGTRVVNARAQTGAHLQSLQAQTDDAFMALTEPVASALLAIPGAAIESLRFDKSQQDLSVTVTVGTFADLEQLKRTMTAQGLVYAEGEARQSGAVTLGQFSVKRP